MILLGLLLVVGIASGATAAISGFGIGSLLTPILAPRYGVPLAIAAISIPHAVATTIRCWRLRASISWPVVRSFGVLSAGGGLVGALLYTRFGSRALTVTLGLLLIATAVAAVSNWMTKLHPTGWVAQSLGFLSGLFGGIAGNQGGLRSAALLAFSLPPAAFVATATATGLAVDAARMPIYLWTSGEELIALKAPISVATAGVLIGTLLGERVLLGISPARFRRAIGALIGTLGIWLMLQ